MALCYMMLIFLCPGVQIPFVGKTIHSKLSLNREQTVRENW